MVPTIFPIIVSAALVGTANLFFHVPSYNPVGALRAALLPGGGFNNAS